MGLETTRRISEASGREAPGVGGDQLVRRRHIVLAAPYGRKNTGSQQPGVNLIPPLTMRPQATKPLCISKCSASKKEYFPTRLSYTRLSGTNTSHVTESQKRQFPSFACSLFRQEQKGMKRRRRWTEYPKAAREKLLKIPPPKLHRSKER